MRKRTEAQIAKRNALMMQAVRLLCELTDRETAAAVKVMRKMVDDRAGQADKGVSRG